jgi:ring-1,2-phenylacetyl-CoA epoxidase subunit PaaD
MVTPEQRAIMETVALHDARPALAAIWRALQELPDPEIPVVSIVELGIVRGVEWDAADDGALIVHLTPTYSGCPATQSIIDGIHEALEWLGVRRLRIHTQLAPAWTTDWMTADAKRKLRDYGIAAPLATRSSSSRHATVATQAIDVSLMGSWRRSEDAVPCPRCDSLDTRLVSQFGSTACKAHFRCNACREPFDYFKPH